MSALGGSGIAEAGNSAKASAAGDKSGSDAGSGSGTAQAPGLAQPDQPLRKKMERPTRVPESPPAFQAGAHFPSRLASPARPVSRSGRSPLPSHSAFLMTSPSDFSGGFTFTA